jgi:hypothetical protein
MTLVLVLFPSLLLIHAGAAGWIAHSKRLAARGMRGRVTRYTSPVFSQDHLGRRLLMDERLVGSREIVISIDGESKSYTPAVERSLPSKVPEMSTDREAKTYTPANEVWG